MRTLLTICGLSLLACWPFPGDAQEESLVLYFSFDKEVADEIKDLSVHQNNGKISGKPKWDKGQIGKKIDKIKDNLNKLKTIYLNTDPEIIAYNRNFQIKKKMW